MIISEGTLLPFCMCFFDLEACRERRLSGDHMYMTGNWHTINEEEADMNPRQHRSNCGCPLWGEAPTSCSLSTWVSEII